MLEQTAEGWKSTGSSIIFTGETARDRAWAVECARDVLKAEQYVTGLDNTGLGALLAQLPSQVVQLTTRFKAQDAALQVVWSEVYVPDVPDAHGEMMRPDTVRKMAWGFCASGKTSRCDIQHDQRESGNVIVESFIARKGDLEFIVGSWVVGMHIPSGELWGRVQKGEFNGFSLQARVFERKVKVDLLIPDEVEGTTDVASDGALHVHTFVVRFDSEGQLTGGETGFADGHRHQILSGSVTAEANGHQHRYSFMDKLFGVPEAVATGLIEG